MPGTTPSRTRNGFGGPVTPMSERQQLKLVRQLETSEPRAGTPPTPPGNPRRPRSCNGRGETPLHKAAIRGDLESVRRLLEEGADPNVPDFAGWTALHEACNHGWTDIAVALLDAGADANVRGFDDDTPLHDAVGTCNAELVRLLVERGANIRARNKRGKTPCDLAPARVLQHVLQPDSIENLAVEKHLNLTSGAVSAAVDMRRTRVEKSPRVTLKLHHKIKRAGKLSFDDLPPVSTNGHAMEEKCKEDVYEFKSSKEATPTSPDVDKDITEKPVESAPEVESVSLGKRTAPDNETEDNEDEVKRKKKREEGGNGGKVLTPAGRLAAVRTGNNGGGKALAHTPTKTATTAGRAALTPSSSSAYSDRKSPCSPKGTAASPVAAAPKADPELEGDAPKVPPLKIVIPQSGQEPEPGNRNGKNNSLRHSALPYVVSSSSNDSEKDEGGSPSDPAIGMLSAEDQKGCGQHQRVLRSHRGGEGSNGSPPAPPLPTTASNPSGGPSPSENSPTGKSGTGGGTLTAESSPTAPLTTTPPPPAPATTTSSTKGSNPPTPGSTGGEEVKNEVAEPSPAPVDLHPRKRKLKREVLPPPPISQDVADGSATTNDTHPPDQTVNNCYQLYLDIRKQVERRRQGLFPVQPKPPQGFKDYLLNRCTYLLASNASTRQIPSSPLPANLHTGLKELFLEQERERHRLRLQHVIEKEKLVLSVEQEILRVHGRAARALANQSVPFSVCTVLKDKEVYNLITPEQEEKDRNARSRYNGRLFLSWLQDVDDKWEKIKEHMLLRHHNEAESLHAVQKMDWGWKMVEIDLCAFKTKPNIVESHVPIVHVSDDFDLLPA